MDLQLAGRAALVTGSSKGIGRAIALALAREGAQVVVHGRDEAQTEQVVGMIVEAGGRASAVLGDLTDEDAARRVITEAEEQAGTIDILVNNAGGSGQKDDWTTTNAGDWLATYDRNVLSAVRLSVRVLPTMRERGWGRIVNISSGAATMPPPTTAAYSAAKAAINAMTASMAKAVAADGVTVNTISPGTIRSERAKAAFRSVSTARGLTAPDAPWRDVERAVLPLFAAVPMERMGSVEELADAVAFLASARASYITGVNLHVDGGFSSLP